MTRFITSMILGLIFWIVSASLLMAFLIPCPATGCEDDLGAGLIAVVICIGTAACSLVGAAMFNVAAWLRMRHRCS